MTISEAIKHCEEVAKEQDKLCKRYDDASGYTRSHNEDIRTTDAKRREECSKEHRQLAEWLKELKCQREVWKKVKAEIEDRFGGYSICEWFEDYDYEENNVSEYMEIGRISDIIDIINKHLTWYENGWDRIELCQDCLDKIIKAESEGER